MALIEFDYGLLDTVIKETNKMGGGFGCYEAYRADIKSGLYNSIAEWKLPGKEPMGHTYIESARTQADKKREKLSKKQTSWKTVSSNLSSFKSFVESKDEAVADEFSTTSSAYTNYKGISGFFTWVGDAFYGSVGVDLANSNGFTRTIADWGKRTADDFDSFKRDTLDWFKHGEGRYWLNMAGSIFMTGAAIVGTVIAIIGIPFTGGASAVIVVGCIGALATGIGAGISAFNTYHTIRENREALRIKDDPARARFHGDVSSYSEHVSKKIYSSPEEYQKYRKIAKAVDTTDGVCTVVSITTGLATTFGTTTVDVTDASGTVEKVTKFDFSPKNVKQNVLKTFGFKTESQVTEIKISSEGETRVFNTGGEAGDWSIKHDSFTSSGVIEDGFEKGKIKQTLSTGDKNISAKYTQKTISQNHTHFTNEYSRTVASNGSTTIYSRNVDTVAVTEKKTLDYSKAIMSDKKVDKLKYIEDLNDNTKKHVTLSRNLKKTKNMIETGEQITKDLKDTSGKNTTETIKRIAKKNKFVNSFDKYVYDLDTSKDATVWDHLKGIGGSNSRKIFSSYDLVVGTN